MTSWVRLNSDFSEMKRIVILFAAVSIGFQSTAQSVESAGEENLKPGWWKIPGTPLHMKVGGYVKFDLIHDLNPIGSPDFFDVSKIPTDGSTGSNTHLNAKETRLLLDLRAPSRIGELRAFVEGDFYGANGAFRLRHAFMELGPHWLAGQYWSNFMDEAIIPPTLDFEKPAAYVLLRHPILRWKTALSNKSYLAFSLEEPSTNAQAPQEPGKFTSPIPDLTARYRYTGSWGHVQVSSFAASLNYLYTSGEKDAVSLFGGNLSGQFNLLKKDMILYQIAFGPGVGRYRGGISAALDENGRLQALSALGATAALRHYWLPHLSTTFVYNLGVENNTEGQPPTDISGTSYLAVNLVWDVTEDVFVGAEYLHGTRENINRLSGSANRLQFSARYSFNMR